MEEELVDLTFDLDEGHLSAFQWEARVRGTAVNELLVDIISSDLKSRAHGRRTANAPATFPEQDGRADK